MKFKSNLTCPDLSANFKLLDPPMQRCGHDIPSDPDYDPACGYWSHDEAAILYNVSMRKPNATWLDIGSRLGWTAAHVIEGGARMVHACDQAYDDLDLDFLSRARANLRHHKSKVMLLPWTSEALFTEHFRNHRYAGIVIDGNHDSPEPLNDARRAATHLTDDGVILFHDFIGKPTRDAVNFLIEHGGFKCRVYWTPNLVALCWCGNSIVPPDHQGDKNILWKPHLMEMERDFDFGRCS
jgi:hypothetical protein